MLDLGRRPTRLPSVRDIAKPCLDVVLRCASKPEQAPYGIRHFADAGESTWFEFAQIVGESAANRLSDRRRSYRPHRRLSHPLQWAPAATRLDCMGVAREFGVEPRP
jgi:dTDP-4-dehydrorhamnose reductase